MRGAEVKRTTINAVKTNNLQIFLRKGKSARMNLKPSAIESYFFHRSRLNLHSCFYVGIKLNELPKKSQLIAALKYTVIQHERLTCNVFYDELKKENFLQNILEPLKFCDLIEYHHDWDQLGETEINHIFQRYNFSYNENKSLWKILILPNQNQMLLLTDHVLMDGMSAVHVWETFMEGLQMQQPVEIDETIYSPSLNSSIEKIMSAPLYGDWPIPWNWHIVRQLVSRLHYWFPQTVVKNNRNLIQFANYSFPKDLLDDKPSDGTQKYKVKNTNHQWEFQLSPTHLNDILQECKANNTSLTSLLGALVCTSFEKIAAHEYTGSFLKIELPMNIRKPFERVLKLPSDDKLAVGNFIAVIEFNHKLHQNRGIWDIASQIQRAIRSSSEDKIIDKVNEVKLLEVISSQQYIEDKISLNNGPSSTFEVTNLGFQTFKDACNTSLPFYIVDATFNEPQGISSIFSLSVISTPGNGLHCCISYPNTLTKVLEPHWQYMKDYLNLY